MHTTNYELIVIIAIPITLIVQFWTLVIFHKNKSRWRSYDIPIVAILVESTLRNLAVATYIALQKIDAAHRPAFDYCDIFAWTFNSAHTFHASCLATLSVIGVFSVKLFGKQENLRQYLTPTHVIYHLFCLTTLCACVGVAAILAKPETYEFTATFDLNTFKECDLLPYQLDIKYNAFIIILHTFLALIGVISLFYACVVYIKVKRRGGFDYRKKSTSDLSELSLSTATNRTDKSYYDTYTIHRNNNGFGYDGAYSTMWKSDFSQVSTTVSSTNSRRPLNAIKERKKDEYNGTGLETINPILIVCYLFYHYPVIALCIFPSLITPWPISSVILWLGLLQDLLIPISLGIVDSRFNNWVSRVYRCTEKRHIEGKLPHMGLDGKFRHFSTSQPQSLEINQMHPLRCYPTTTTTNSNNINNLNINSMNSTTETAHKFPITNGSLYTSIDGRVPVIHNYRRHHNDQRNNTTVGINAINLNLHSANLQSRPRMQELKENRLVNNNFCQNYSFPSVNVKSLPSSSNSSMNNELLHQNHYQLPHQHLQQPTQHNHGLLKPYLKHVSLSQNSLRQIPLGNEEATKIRSKSYESLNELTTESKSSQERLQLKPGQHSDDEDDEYQDYDSSSSSFSITTEANGDFEFFHKTTNNTNVNQLPDTRKFTRGEFRASENKNNLNEFKIKRSNSKRSLENLQAYIDEDYFSQQESLQRSCSMMSAEKSLSAEFLNENAREANFLDVEWSPFLCWECTRLEEDFHFGISLR